MTDLSTPAADGRVAAGATAYVTLTAAALLVSIPFLLPVHWAPLPNFFQEVTAFGLGLVIVAGVAAASRQNVKIQVPAATILFGAFAIFVYGQTYLVVIPYREHAETWMWFLLWAAAMVFAVKSMCVWIGAATVVPVLATAATIGALLSAGAGLAQWLGVSATLSPLVVTDIVEGFRGNFLQPNLFGNYLVAGIVSIGYLWQSRAVRAPVLFGTLLLLTFVLHFTASRASLLMLAGLTILAAIWRWRVTKFAGKEVNRWLCTALFAWGLIFLEIHVSRLLSDVGVGAVAPALLGEHAKELLDSASLRRLFLAEKAWEIFLSSPWIGVGSSGYRWAYYDHSLDPSLIPSPPGGWGIEHHAHNIVLQFLAEFGLVGFFSLTAFAVMTMREIARHFRVRATPELVWAAAIILAEMLHSLVEFPLWNAHFLGLTALALGVSAQGTRWQPDWTVVRIGLSGAALVGAGLLVLHLAAFDRLIGLVSLSESAGSTVVVEDSAWVRRTLLRPYIDVGIVQSFDIDRQNLERKLALNQVVMQYWPRYRIVHNQILLLTMAGRDEEARTLLERTRRVDGANIGNLEHQLSGTPVTEISADSWLRAAVLARPL